MDAYSRNQNAQSVHVDIASGILIRTRLRITSSYIYQTVNENVVVMEKAEDTKKSIKKRYLWPRLVSHCGTVNTGTHHGQIIVKMRVHYRARGIAKKERPHMKKGRKKKTDIFRNIFGTHLDSLGNLFPRCIHTDPILHERQCQRRMNHFRMNRWSVSRR